MTRKEMVDQIQAWLGLQSIDDYDEIPLIEDMIYRGTIDLLSRTRCVVRCVHLRTIADTETYTLDHAIMALVEVEDGSSRRLRRDQTGNNTPGFTLIRSDILQVKPTPSEDGELDVWAVMLPNQMSDDTQSPGDEGCGAIPEEFQDAIILYALWQLADYADNAMSQKGERYRVLYEGADQRGGRIAQIKMLVNKRGTARAASRRVRMSRVLDRGAWVG